MSNEDVYDAETIQELDDIEHVRKRPAMYIGDTSVAGLHHLISEVVDNSIDEAMEGYCDEISVTVDGTEVTVTDNGRGIPVKEHESGMGTLELVLTKLKTGGKFGNKNYETSGGLHGVGVSCVNALSSQLTATVWRDGQKHVQEFERGEAASELNSEDSDHKPGTSITFEPDDEIFETMEFAKQRIANRLEELAYLNPGVTIMLDFNGDEETYHSDEGMSGFLKTITTNRSPEFDPISIEGEAEVETSEGRATFAIDLALQAIDVKGASAETIHSFANNINTSSGGKHVEGLKRAVTRVLSDQQDQLGYKTNQDLGGQDFRRALAMAISVRCPDPQFEGQTKRKLGNQEAVGAVSDIVGEEFAEWCSNHKTKTKKILKLASAAYEMRQAAKEAEEMAYSEQSKNTLNRPKNLATCRTEQGGELFIVEGDSAGGTAKQARDQETQAILALRGKFTNVERKSKLKKILSNDVVKSIANSLRIGIRGAGEGEYRPDELAYDKIVILTDADPDGYHIETLLLTFFYRYYEELIADGKIYIARTPLYSAVIDGGKQYFYPGEDVPGSAKRKQRFKGLGEMNQGQLKETSLDPETRQLVQVTMEDSRLADERTDALMGRGTSERKKAIFDRMESGD